MPTDQQQTGPSRNWQHEYTQLSKAHEDLRAQLVDKTFDRRNVALGFAIRMSTTDAINLVKEAEIIYQWLIKPDQSQTKSE